MSQIRNKISLLQDNTCVGWKYADGWNCPMSGAQWDASGFDIDHIIEKSWTQCDDISNLQALCKSCHSVKTKQYMSSPIFKMKRQINILHIISHNEVYALVPISCLDTLVQNWVGNRPPDETRVNDIIKTIHNNTYVESCLYIAECGVYGQLVCYDGIHRMLALLKTQKIKQVLCNIVLRCTYDDIKSRFYVLNQSNPVPDLYFDDNMIRHEIEDCVSRIMKLWPTIFSSSSRPRRPNTNRDRLISSLYEFCKHHEKGYTSDMLYDMLILCNDKYKNGKHITISKYSNQMQKKCISSGCYLFLKDFIEDL